MLKRIHSFLALAVVLVLALWWLFGRPTGQPPALPTPSARTSPAATELVAPAVAVETAKREEFAPPAPLVAPKTEPELARVRGRCVAAESGAPLAGCTVTFDGMPGNSDAMERYGEVEWNDPAPIVTQEDGRFEIAFVPPPPFQHGLDVQCAERAPRTARWGAFRPGQIEDLGDIELALGYTVEGHVVDTAGSPVAGAYVALDNLPLPLRGDMAANNSRGGASNERGDFRIDVPIPAGTWTVDARGRGFRLVSPDSVTVAERSGAAFVTVVMRAMPSISGVVVDDTGAGVEDAYVMVEMHGSGRMASAWTRDDGSFTIHAVTDELAPARLTIDDAGTCEPLAEPTQPYEWGTKDIRIELRRARSFQLVVVEQDTGAPVEDYAVECAFQENEWNTHGDVRLGGRHPAGRMTVDGVRRGVNRVSVVPTNPLLVQDAPVVLEVSDGEIPEVRVALLRSKIGTVRVVDASRRPVEGSRVELVSLADEPFDADSFVVGKRSGGSYSSDPGAFHTVVGDALSDDHGLARVRIPFASAKLGLRVTGDSHLTTVMSDVKLSSDAEPLEVVVGPGARITGTVHFVGYANTELGLAFARDGHDSNGEEPNATIGADGAFESPRLVPGTYSLFLSLDHHETSEHGGSSWKLHLEPALGVVVALDDRTTSVELDAAPLAPGAVVGTILLNGAPFGECRVYLVRDGARFGQFVPNAEGRFEASGLPPGTWSAELVVGDFKAREGDRIFSDATFELAPGGKVTRDFAFERRKITLRVLQADGVTPLADTTVGIDFVRRGQIIERGTDANGILILDPAPTGSVRFYAKGLFAGPVELPTADDGRAFDVVLRGP
ncbi:MAG: carboxypeptidase-like regulatory domain-containing protein [Planctomycetes bacterium]|nr:carboxypeptidase-like regulatory domain-containing protein [Planctomycetota bacterium]